jgi:hypothetical protein
VNRLIARLPDADRDRLLAHREPVEPGLSTVAADNATYAALL